MNTHGKMKKVTKADPDKMNAVGILKLFVNGIDTYECQMITVGALYMFCLFRCYDSVVLQSVLPAAIL